MRRLLAGCVALAVVAGGAGVAYAAPCVGIAPGARTSDAARDKFVDLLGASLAQHGIALCGADEPPAADVVVTGTDRAVVISVRDTVTRKTVTREVSLTSIPRDGRPLALAVAVGELLRASWAEILLARAPSPPQPPPEVRAIVEASLERPVTPSPRAARDEAPAETFFVTAAPAIDHATGGMTLLGGDLRFGAWLGSRLAVELRIGGRGGLAAQGGDGSATANAVGGGLGALAAVVPRGRVFALDVPVRVDVDAIEIQGHPSSGARGSGGWAAGATASTGLAASVRVVGGWCAAAEATVGVVLHRVDANDGASTFTALAGAVVGGMVGVRALF